VSSKLRFFSGIGEDLSKSGVLPLSRAREELLPRVGGGWKGRRLPVSGEVGRGQGWE
jgi:hypothetical protein